jgi:salicylate hydroxylase
MSPFKGQGANQALLDALSLARVLYRATTTTTTKSTTTIPLSPLKEYELEMLERSAVKVQASADAADFLHSPIAIQRGNCTRGGAAAAVAAAATAAVTAKITTTKSSP